MKKLLIIALTFASINIAAGQVWAQYDFQVESAEAQAKIIAASNELMSSDFAKENLKGSVHLDVYISNGSSSATHSFAVLQPSMAAHQDWMMALQTKHRRTKVLLSFELKLNCGKQRINSFIGSYGTASNEDICLANTSINHRSFRSTQRLIKAFEKWIKILKVNFLVNLAYLRLHLVKMM